MMFNRIEQRFEILPQELMKWLYATPRVHLVAKASAALARASAEQSMMVALAPSEFAWDFISGAITTNPAKLSEAGSLLQNMQDKILNVYNPLKV